MIDYPPTFDQASLIVGQLPLPEDWEKQLDALRKQTPKKFHDMFDDFYEAVYAMSPEPPPES